MGHTVSQIEREISVRFRTDRSASPTEESVRYTIQPIAISASGREKDGAILRSRAL